MKTIHLVSHTHWDREWYRTFQQFRLRLVHLVDGLLDILAHDRDYRHFMLDGQTIVLDDYLYMRPENEAALREHVRKGRILIGPWHILPDMFLVSPEAHIRNLLAGDRAARRFGPKMMIGYMPDSFGHIGQMPQILRGFGIDNACLWRGLDEQPPEFWWQSPDGSRVLMLYLRDSYSNGAGLNTSDPDVFVTQIQAAADSLAAHSHAEDLLVMNGTDHMQPSPDTARAIRFANRKLKDYRVRHSTLPAYRAAIHSKILKKGSDIPTVIGELRSSKRSHLLPGVLSTRMWIKQRNHACENLLEKWAEPFSAFASLTTRDYQPAHVLRQAWQLLMECHPHDSICGCSIDQVHEEMKPRFDQVEQIGEEITAQSLGILADAVKTTGDSLPTQGLLSAITVFNPLSVQRTDVVEAQITLPPGVTNFEINDGLGNLLPHQSSSGKRTELIHVSLRRSELGSLLGMVNEGRAGNLAIQDLRFERAGAVLRVEAAFSENAEPDMDVWRKGQEALRGYLNDTDIETFQIRATTPDSAGLIFTAAQVPALGWKTFYVRARENAPVPVKVSPLMRALAPLAKLTFVQKFLARLSQPKAHPPYIIENDFILVELNAKDRTLTLRDKSGGKIYYGLNRFVDGGDCGDEYNFSPPPRDSLHDAPKLSGVTITRGPVQQTMSIALLLSIPTELASDRQSRSREMTELPITTTITLTAGVPRADIHTSVDNRARDHRLRVHFPFPAGTVKSASYDGHFEILERAVGLPHFDETWVEAPRPETSQRAFTSVASGGSTFTVANRGLPEVEVISTPESAGTAIALTLLRCVGWLSRDDFSTRKGHAGPFLETPAAQMPGRWEFDYAVILGQPPDASRQQAWNFESPLRAAVTGLHDGTLPSSGSFISVSDPRFTISAVKEAESGHAWIVRGYNTGPQEIPVTLKTWRKFSGVEQVNMAEETLGRLKVNRENEVELNARGCEVVTIKFQ